MNEMNRKFVICLQNDGSDDLQIRKVYQALPDSGAEKRGLMRIIDDSGEDYLYPINYFAPVALPRAVEKRLFAGSVAVI